MDRLNALENLINSYFERENNKQMTELNELFKNKDYNEIYNRTKVYKSFAELYATSEYLKSRACFLQINMMKQ